MQKYLEMSLPIVTVSESNCFEHWTKKHKRHTEQKKAIWAEFKRIRPVIILPSLILITRIGKRLMDDDNIPASVKWIRDALAGEIFPGLRPGQADSDPRIEWKYAQKKDKEYQVKIEFFKT
jgi:hypothetical protein